MRAVHHFVPVVHRGDAVGRHTLRLRDACRHRGLSSHVFVDVTDPRTRDETMPVTDYAAHARPDDILVYQFATASYMASWLISRRETLVVNYHNITPPELIEPWDRYVALGQRCAQDELRTMAGRSALAVADSAYNERHLVEAGFAVTAVVPPSAALSADIIGAAVRTREPLAGRGARWLSVGRLAPNKAVEDTIAALAVARAHDDPGATLLILGRPAGASYDAALRHYVADLGLAAAVTFGGFATDAAVAAAYARADVLVVTSEHEGFCVPVVEAMAVGLPVVAYDEGALPEVLGGSGVIVDSKDPYLLSSVITSLVRDGRRQAQLADAAAGRLDELALGTAAARFVDLLGALPTAEGVRS
ncbi:MAG TPA: glycosyltransferase [Acidimicrobiales bacterium]|nr:glycosyltransferase [Acidimicrobiales bacterium]